MYTLSSAWAGRLIDRTTAAARRLRRLCRGMRTRMKIHRRWMLGKRCALTGMLALAAAGVAQEGLAAAYGDMMRAASGLIRATAPAALPTPQQYISGFVLY